MDANNDVLLARLDENVKHLRTGLLGGDGQKGALDEIREWQKEHTRSDEERFTSIDTQLESIRERQWYWKGGLAVLGLELMLIATVIAALWEHLHSGGR